MSVLHRSGQPISEETAGNDSCLARGWNVNPCIDAVEYTFSAECIDPLFPTGDPMKAEIIRFAVWTALALFAVVQLPTAMAQETRIASRQVQTKVVFQVSDNDPGKWNLVLNNAANAQKELGAALVAEIVAYGPGISMLESDSAVAKRIESALSSGIRIVACENTMKALKLTRNEMLPGIGYVAAGVVELIERQQQGYAYIRP
jgi:intracellular sulfur oxidation DsrE/DsrF family protein